MALSKLDFKRFSIELWLLKDIRGPLLEKIINNSIKKYFLKFRIAKYRKEHLKSKNFNLKNKTGLEILCLNPRITEFEKLFAKEEEIKEKNLHKALLKIINLFNKELFTNLKGDFYYFHVIVVVTIEQKFIYKGWKRFREIKEEFASRDGYEFEFSTNTK